MTTTDAVDSVLRAVDRAPHELGRARVWMWVNSWWLFLVVAVAAAIVIVVRGRLVRRSLRDRASVEVLPTSGFDPVLEDVVRFANQVAQAQRSSSRWFFIPARGTAMRVRLASSGGPLTLRIEGPTRAVSVLRHQGYRQCELRAVTGDSEPVESARPEIRIGAARNV